MGYCSKDIKFPLTIEELRQLNFPTVYAKVSGFIIAKTIDRYTRRQTDYIKVRISRKKNTIIGLQNLIDALATYMGGATYGGPNLSQSGIAITTTTGTQFTLPFTGPAGVSPTSSGAIVTFLATDNSNNSYNVASEELITQSAGANIPVATGSVPITKQSNEVLTIQWLINIDLSISGNLQYIPTSIPQQGGVSCGASGSCTCVISSAQSQFSFGCSFSNAVGLTTQYPKISFVTTQLFTDMFYNSYSKGGSSSFIATTSNTIYIYSVYCSTYFFAGIVDGIGCYIAAFGSASSSVCSTATSATYDNIIYLQLYYPQQPANYIGAQVVYST